MFGFNVKEMFQQQISDILICLCIIHLGTVMVSFLIRWIHPYLNTYATKYNKDKGKKFDNGCSRCVSKKYNKKDYLDLQSHYDTDSNDELLDLVNNLESTDDQLFRNRKNYFKNVLQEIMLGIESNNDVKRFVMKQIQHKKRSSSEAQTNVTINPTIKFDYSCPNTVCSCLATENPLQSSTSSEYFESASSGSSDVDFYETEYVPILRHSGFCDILKPKSSNQSSKTNRLNKKYLSSKINYQRNVYVETDLLSSASSKDCRTNVFQENKLLEMAINEFERELKPIREQIKVLKDCLKGFDHCKTQLSHISDVSTSVSGSVLQSEGISGTLSTVFSSNVYDKISSHHIFQKKQFTKREIKPKVTSNYVAKNGASNDLKSNRKYFISDSSTNHPEPKQTQRLSPLAEMYIKLSQCNSKSAGFLINSEQQKATHTFDSENVTCHILLNVNVGAISVTSIQNNHRAKELNFKPLLSEPEDILGKSSSTYVSLRSAN